MSSAKGQLVGYIRVSTVDQNTVRQLDGVELDERFEDKVSGKDLNRPQLEAAIKHCRKGDTFIVHSMDRLSRSLTDLLAVVKELNEKGVTVQFHKENLAFTGDDSPMSMLMLNIMGSVVQFEREMIKERQREGIVKARAEGKYKGRAAALDAKQVTELKERAAKGENKAALARDFKITRTTLYKYLDQKEQHQ